MDDGGRLRLGMLVHGVVVKIGFLGFEMCEILSVLRVPFLGLILTTKKLMLKFNKQTSITADKFTKRRFADHNLKS